MWITKKHLIILLKKKEIIEIVIESPKNENAFEMDVWNLLESGFNADELLKGVKWP